MFYRTGTLDDLGQLLQLSVQTWSKFEALLSPEHYLALYNNISNPATYTELLSNSECFVCANDKTIIGMAFLMPGGKERDIYEAGWCSIRFVTVHPDYSGQGIGRHLTQLCIGKAKENGEKVIALHTSEIMPNARHIYESIGFKILKEIPPRFGKRYWLYTMDI